MEERIGILEEGQQLAADLGSIVEIVKGEQSAGCAAVTESLQSYCDALYCLYERISEDDYTEKAASDALISLRNCLDNMSKVLAQQVMDRGEVLFLSTGPELWEGFREIYEIECASGADVTVLFLPVCFKDCYGRLMEEDIEDSLGAEGAEENRDYPPDLLITSWRLYDIGLHFPDRIYIQDAYDGENPCLSIPEQYYSSVIRSCCGELILVPALTPDEFGETDFKEMYNMRSYVTVPGVVYADRILLKADWLKERYLEKLCEWSGEENRTYWDNKMEVLPQTENNKAKSIEIERKHILYILGLDGIVLHGENYIAEFNDRMNVLLKEPAIDRITISYFPSDIKEWKKESPQLTERLIELIYSYTAQEKCDFLDPVFKDNKTDMYTEYYGSASPLMLSFIQTGKSIFLDLGLNEL